MKDEELCTYVHNFVAAFEWLLSKHTSLAREFPSAKSEIRNVVRSSVIAGRGDSHWASQVLGARSVCSEPLLHIVSFVVSGYLPMIILS